MFTTAYLPDAATILDRAFTDLHHGPVGWSRVEEAVADHEGPDPHLVRELSLIGSRNLRLAGPGESSRASRTS